MALCVSTIIPDTFRTLSRPVQFRLTTEPCTIRIPRWQGVSLKPCLCGRGAERRKVFSSFSAWCTEVVSVSLKELRERGCVPRDQNLVTFQPRGETVWP